MISDLSLRFAVSGCVVALIVFNSGILLAKIVRFIGLPSISSNPLIKKSRKIAPMSLTLAVSDMISQSRIKGVCRVLFVNSAKRYNPLDLPIPGGPVAIKTLA